MRFTRTIVAGLLIIGLVGSMSGCTPPAEEKPVEAAGPTAVVVTVEGDKQPTVQIASLGEAELEGIVGIAALTGEGGIVFGTPIDIELEGEMPAGGATLTRVYPAPLPEGTAATFAYWDEEGETWAATPTTLNADRTTITATVDHFSTWLDVVAANTQATWNTVVAAASTAGEGVATWTGKAVTAAAEATLWSLGNIASVRVELPECDVPTPNWVLSETLQDDPTHPVRLCVGHDAQDPDLLVVKARSNRAYGFSVDLAVQPAWEYNATAENNLATVISTVAAVDANVGQSVVELLNNGRFVGGGKEVSFGLPESSFRNYGYDYLLKLSPPSAQQFVFSMLAQELVGAGISEADGYLGAAIALAGCLDSGLKITEVGNLSSFIATCLTSIAEQGANMLTNALVKKGYAEVPALKTAKTILGKATLTFALFSGGAAAADYALENVAYSDADRTVQVAVAKNERWLIDATGIGPLKIGASVPDVQTLEAIIGPEHGLCNPASRGSFGMDFSRGSDGEVGAILLLGPPSEDAPATRTGVTLGSAASELAALGATSQDWKEIGYTIHTWTEEGMTFTAQVDPDGLITGLSVGEMAYYLDYC